MKLIKFGVALLAITSILTGCASDRDKVLCRNMRLNKKTLKVL